MKKLLALIIKDILLLLRDWSGLLVLFLMPVALIVVISLVHQSALEVTATPTIHLLVLDYHHDFPIESLTNELQRTNYLDTRYQREKPPFTSDYAQRLMDRYHYTACLIIQPSVSEEETDFSEEPPVIPLKLVIDPVVPSASRRAMLYALSHVFISMELLNLLELHQEDLGESFDDIHVPEYGSPHFPLETIQTSKEHDHIQPTATQQNVPAWTLFAMFFIVIPLSAQLIDERQNGMLTRVMATAAGYPRILLSKIIVFVLVCLAQFFLMLLAGFYLLPLLGISRLVIGSAYTSMMVVALASALAATGFGILVGTVATTHQQASVFGAVSIVIAAALGGIMVPIFAMPHTMQTISHFSPLAWGLNAFLDVFLRNAPLRMIRHDVLLLCAFFLTTLILSLLYRIVKIKRPA